MDATMSTTNSKQNFGTIIITDNTRIEIKLIKFREETGLDIRTFVTGAKYSGPTKTGIRIPLNKLDDFKKIISSVETNKK